MVRHRGKHDDEVHIIRSKDIALLGRKTWNAERQRAIALSLASASNHDLGQTSCSQLITLWHISLQHVAAADDPYASWLRISHASVKSEITSRHRLLLRSFAEL